MQAASKFHATPEHSDPLLGYHLVLFLNSQINSLLLTLNFRGQLRTPSLPAI